MIIVGGTYKEIVTLCPESEVIYGSGVRAVDTILQLDKDISINFYTCCRSFERKIQLRYASFKNLKFHITQSEDVTFYYLHPFNLSCIRPRPDYFIHDRKFLEIKGEDVLVFGMLEADFHINAKRVVYDPQNSVRPVLFSNTGSQAESLGYILNAHEASAITGSDEMDDQARFLFEREKCKFVVIKNGAKGAYVYDQNVDTRYNIPVYVTPKVSCIGSGDVFSATFAYYWFKGHSVKEAAQYASKAVACYAASGSTENLFDKIEHFSYSELIPQRKGQIYLAGPFFSLSQHWLISEFYNALHQENVNIFSPLHHVGFGGDETAKADLDGLNRSDVILAIADGLDAGTMFEVGYAVKKGIPVVVFNSCEHGNDLQMLSGTGCDIVNDFATAVYKSIWYAIK